MIARIPWPMLTPSSFDLHIEDVVLIYADKFRSEAEAEAGWMANVMAMHGDPPQNMIMIALARALRIAALELEAASCSTHSGTGPSNTDG